MVLIEEVPQENVAAAPPEKDPEPEQKQPSIAEREEGNGADDEEWVEVSHQDAASLGKEGSKDLDHSGEKHNIPEDPEVYKVNWRSY